MNNRHPITKAGQRKLQQELAYLKKEKRKEIAEQIKEHRSYCDFADNTAFTQLLEQQAQVNDRIITIENLLLNAKLNHHIDEDYSKVHLGNTVTIMHLPTGPKEQYTIVSSVEADPLLNKISVESPIGKSLLGSPKGAKKKVSTPSGEVKIKIVDIQ